VGRAVSNSSRWKFGLDRACLLFALRFLQLQASKADWPSIRRHELELGTPIPRISAVSLSPPNPTKANFFSILAIDSPLTLESPATNPEKYVLRGRHVRCQWAVFPPPSGLFWKVAEVRKNPLNLDQLPTLESGVTAV